MTLASAPRDVLALPWVLAEPEPAIPAELPSAPNLPALVAAHELAPDLPEPASRDLTRWEGPALIAAFAWCLCAGLGAVTGLISLSVWSWQLGALGAALLPVLAGLVVTCPRPPETETFRTWGNELTAYAGQCTPSRQTFTGRSEQ